MKGIWCLLGMPSPAMLLWIGPTDSPPIARDCHRALPASYECAGIITSPHLGREIFKGTVRIDLLDECGTASRLRRGGRYTSVVDVVDGPEWSRYYLGETDFVGDDAGAVVTARLDPASIWSVSTSVDWWTT